MSITLKPELPYIGKQRRADRSILQYGCRLQRLSQSLHRQCAVRNICGDGQPLGAPALWLLQQRDGKQSGSLEDQSQRRILGSGQGFRNGSDAGAQIAVVAGHGDDRVCRGVPFRQVITDLGV